MNKQEMFDKAYKGLASQGFERCATFDTGCQYYRVKEDGAVMRCAWGWVDPEATQDKGSVSIYTLSAKGVGVAATMKEDTDEFDFAVALQTAHDSATDSRGGADFMKSALEDLAERHGLTVPAL